MRLVFERALVAGSVVRGVTVDVACDGTIAHVGRVTPQESGPVIAGLALPGMPNLHSHAFQRAMAGTAETAGATNDSFWTWRDTMYRFVDRLSPQDVRAIGAYAYLEMLKAGYTAVAEFHYLHHQADGTAYTNPAELAVAIREAAASTGIRQTLLPSLYQTGGFGGVAPRAAQRRFVHSADAFLRLFEQLHTQADSLRSTGIALHSLRAVPAQVLQEVVAAVRHLNRSAPVHIHVAEQQQEVVDCLEATGQRPVAYLMGLDVVDRNWCLVHATHVDAQEMAAIARSQAVVGLCLTTEANLGDGRFALDELLTLRGFFGIGSDSHVSIDPREELRLAEYNLRLWRQQRAVIRSDEQKHCGTLLYETALAGGARALGRSEAVGFTVGADADVVVLDTEQAAMAGVQDDALVDQYIFAPRPGLVRDVMVGGQWVVQQSQHAAQLRIERDYVEALQRLQAL